MGTFKDQTPGDPNDAIEPLRGGDRQAPAALFDPLRDHTLHRQHVGTTMQDAGQEIAPDPGALPRACSTAMAAMLLGRHTSPTRAAPRAERTLRVQEALNRLDSIEREVLALRPFELLGRAEAALVLGNSREAAAKRYSRARTRLEDVLAIMPGGTEGP